MKPLQVFLCVLVLLSVSPAGDAADVWVRIAEPRKGSYVIGEVEIVAEVTAAEPVEGVEFRVDGRSIGMVTSPPYQVQVDLGEANIGHLFEVIARCTAGGEASDSVNTEPVPISGAIDVELQQLYVTVSRDGQRILNLSADDFEVVDEGEHQQLVTFESGDVPLTAMLLIDSSESMAGDKLRAAVQGAVAFVDHMEVLDRVKLLFFSDRLMSSSRFTGARGVDVVRLATSRAAGGTALYDHLFIALKQLEQRQGRRVVIVLSDGVDSHSTLDMEAIAEVARRSQAQIHWIRMRRAGRPVEDDKSIQTYTPWRTADENLRQLELLKETIARSGGETYPIEGIEQIEGVFLSILRQLREQYVLGYYPSDNHNDGAWHGVRVRVARPGLEVRAAAGYIDF